MAVVLESNARNAGIEAITDLLDAGNIFFQTGGSVEVAECTFNATAFGAAAAGVVTAAAIVDDSDADGGVIANALLRTSGDATVATVTVTATGGGGDITISSLTIGAGDTVSISSLTMTQPAS